MFQVGPSPFRGRLVSPGKAAPQKPEQKRKYGCAMLLLPPELAREILAWVARAVPTSARMPDGGEGEPHVTLKYGFHDLPGERQKVATLVRGHGPVNATLGPITMFPDSGDGEVLKIEVQSSELHSLYQQLSQSFNCEDRFFPHYRPHVTLAYLKPGHGKRYVGLGHPFAGRQLTLDRLKYSSAKKEVTLTDLARAKVMSAYSAGSGGDLIAPPAWMGPKPRQKEKEFPALTKALEERRDKRGRPYCFEKGRGRVPCPPKVGASPLKRASTPERIVSGDTPTSGKVRKQGSESVSDNHPFAGKSSQEMRQELHKNTGTGSDTNPWNLKPEADPVVLDSIVKYVGERMKKNSFHKPTMTEAFATVKVDHPALTLREFQNAILAGMKAGRLRADPYTQAVNTMPEDGLAAAFPLDKEVKFYLDVGSHGGAQTPSGNAAIGRKWNSVEGEHEVVGVSDQGRLLVSTPGTNIRELIRPEELEKRIDFDRRQQESQARMTAAAAAREEVEKEQKRKREDTNGFAEQFKPHQRQKIIDALSRNVLRDGKIISRRDLVRKLVNEGYTVGVHPKHGRSLFKPNGDLGPGQSQISKTAMDYAEYLINNKLPDQDQKSLQELTHHKALEEKTDKRGQRYCIEKGRGRVPCPPKVGASPVRRVGTKIPPEEFASLIKQAGDEKRWLKADQIQILGEAIRKYTKADIQKIREGLGLGKDKGKKQEMAAALFEEVRQRLEEVSLADAPDDDGFDFDEPEREDGFDFDDGDLIDLSKPSPTYLDDDDGDLIDLSQIPLEGGEKEKRPKITPPIRTGEEADRHVVALLENGFKNSNLSPQQMKSYSGSLVTALKNMPPLARDLAASNLKEFRFAASPKEIAQISIDNMPKDIDAIIRAKEPWEQEQIFREVIGVFKRTNPRAADLEKELEQVDAAVRLEMVIRLTTALEQDAARRRVAELEARGVTLLGGYEMNSQVLTIDGGVNPKSGGEFDDTAENNQLNTYAHELAHAIDHKFQFSGQDAWVEAWREEIEGGRLTQYATTQVFEGFAEFLRLPYSGNYDLRRIEQVFPKATKFCKDNGLWPEGK